VKLSKFKGTLGLIILIILWLTSPLGTLQAQAAEGITGADLFRQIFAATVDPSAPNMEQVNQLIYAPVPKLLNERNFFEDRCEKISENVKHGDEAIARGMLCKMHDVYANVTAQDLYNRGTQSKAAPIDLTTLTQTLKSKDLLIVVVPGIFGEFIQKRAFEEVFPVLRQDGTFENDSSFAREWRNALEAKTSAEVFDRECSNVTVPSSVCDEQELLARLSTEKKNRGQQNVSMAQLMNVGSIDDKNGQPSVRVVLFQMDPMTLESLGKQANNAKIFSRRLEKFFEIIGHTPSSIAFVGYSRGTDYALEMLSQAKKENKPWLENVKAMVSLGGVVFGSALADDVVLNKKSPVNRQIHLVNVLRDSLTLLPAIDEAPYGKQNMKWLGYNTLAWWKFISAMAKTGSIKSAETAETAEVTKQTSALTADLIKQDTQKVIAWLKQLIDNRGIADPAFAANMLMTESMKFGLITSNIEQDVLLLSEALQSLLNGDTKQITHFIRTHLPERAHENPNPYTITYNSHIRRFKKLAAAALQGVNELTTDSRLTWWRTHEVPLHVRYYSISGTMAPQDNPLASNRFAYNPGSPDDLSLIQNWTDLSNVKIGPEYAGVPLNDSQVAIYKSMFWPRLIASLNPANRGMQTSSLGIVGTHHWGMALPIVVQVKKIGLENGPGLMLKNPFPRAALMKSLALTIANDLGVDEKNSSQGAQK
jgi:hypothetical protein